MKKFVFSMLGLMVTLSLTPLAQAQDMSNNKAYFISEGQLGGSYTSVNAATAESTEVQNLTGTLVEIGNTTAENTTIVIRFKNTDGTTTDEAVEITNRTAILNRAGGKADLSDWIAGDQIQVRATHFRNSDGLEALNLHNLSFETRHRGINGWITALRPSSNQMDVTYNNTVYTLNTADAKMVGGIHNPATLADFRIGDRVRARVVEDGDGSSTTWKAEIVVTLRRGDDLIMRVTRWIVPATITALPVDVSTLPATLEVSIQDSKFFQKNDVNNLIGAPGTLLKVDINNETKLVRQYLGKANLNEFSVGDDIRIIGRLNEVSGHLVARVIKDNSIQRIDQRFRTATITAINASNKSLTVQLDDNQLPYPGPMTPMTPVARTWNVTTNNATTYWRAGKQVTFADLQTDTMIRIFGTVNIDNRQIAASTISVIIKPTGIELPQ
jgi:hypothetical protein